MVIFYFYLWFSVVLVVYRFFVVKRIPDLLTIYAFTLILFSLAVMFGRVSDPVNEIFVLADDRVLVITAISFNGLYLVSLVKKSSPVVCRRDSVFAETIFLWSGLFVCLLLFYMLRDGLFSSLSKKDLLESVDFKYVVLTSLIPVFLFVSVRIQRYWLASVFFGMALVLFLFGSRRALVVCALGVWLAFYSDKKMILARQLFLAVVALFGLFFVMAGKTLYGSLLANGMSGFSIWWDAFDFNLLLQGGEFLGRSGILQATVVKDFSIPFWVVPGSLLAALPVPLSWFDLSSSMFNDLFQAELFPGIEYGMAYNPWAEAYSWFGYIGVVTYSVLIPFFLACVDYAWRKIYGDKIFGLILVVLGLLVAFWVHRNSLGSELAYLRNLFYPSFILCSFAIFVAAIFKK